jgi:hypothetical protein
VRHCFFVAEPEPEFLELHAGEIKDLRSAELFFAVHVRDVGLGAFGDAAMRLVQQIGALAVRDCAARAGLDACRKLVFRQALAAKLTIFGAFFAHSNFGTENGHATWQ